MVAGTRLVGDQQNRSVESDSQQLVQEIGGVVLRPVGPQRLRASKAI
jgi:hypothetical protein